MMYNANLDKSEEYRKTLSDLRSELKRWEQTSRGSKFSVTDSATHGVSPYCPLVVARVTMEPRECIETNSIG